MKRLYTLVALPLALVAVGVALFLYASMALDDVMLAGSTDWWEGEA